MQQLMIPSGTHLQKSLGTAYYALGFGFNRGSITGHDGTKSIIVDLEEAELGSSDRQFSKEKFSRFLMDFRRLDEPIPVIDESVISRNVGARYYPEGGYRHHVLAESYDGLVFLESIQHSVLIGD